MKIIVFNSTKIIPDGQNNKLVYSFPNSVTFQNSYIAVSSVSLYYSWFNITAAQQNNVFSYNWTVGAQTTTYFITIPDGLYEVSTLNKLLQYEMISNGTYLIAGDQSQNVYYAEFSLNPTRYAVQLNTFEVPTSLPDNYAAPSNFAGFPSQTFNPVIDLSLSQIYKILGFSVILKVLVIQITLMYPPQIKHSYQKILLVLFLTCLLLPQIYSQIALFLLACPTLTTI